MKKALIILLLFTLPWHAMAAVQRSLAHMMGTNGVVASFVMKHAAEHASYVPHHHDDDDGDAESGVAHEDNSQKSFKHLADFEQGCGVQMLLSPTANFPIAFAPRLAPEVRPETYSDRSTLPLFRPPRARA